MRPKVLLMDEPFAALDVQTRAKMQDFLLDGGRVGACSQAIALADRVVVFTARPGRVETIVPVGLARPHGLFSREAAELRRELTRLLQDAVDRAFAEREALAAK